MRKNDGHLLTVDTDTFVGDGRFQVLHSSKSDAWTLHLRGARAADAGQYECQVSSENKMSLVYHLNVVGEYKITSDNFKRITLIKKNKNKKITFFEIPN